VRVLLWPFSLLYRVFAYADKSVYTTGIRKPVRLPKPVISVGNLTVGGTGKTPFVDALLTSLKSKGLRPCVLTRGYGRKSEQTFVVIDRSTTDQVGDEPLWLFQRHPDAQIVVSTNRAEAGLKVKDADVFVLDDGLQHRKVEKDYQITLIDATRPDWHYNVLPYGFAREKWKAIRRSDLVVITRANLVSEKRVDDLVDKILKQGVLDVVECSIHFDKCSEIITGNELSLSGRRVALVSGIGNPESFEQIVKQTGASIVGHLRYSDHMIYDSRAVLAALEKARSLKVDALLMTEKDAVKWRENRPKDGVPIPCLVGVVRTKLRFNPGLPDIYELAHHHIS
jgi:tetraacyldisaccharide 4'-kinase